MIQRKVESAGKVALSQGHRDPRKEKEPNAGQRKESRCGQGDIFGSLENHAAGGFPLVEGEECGSGGGLKYVVDTFTCQGGALEVFASTNLCPSLVAFFGRNELQRLLTHFFDGQGIFTEIFLKPDEDDWDAGASLVRFFDPLCPNVNDWYCMLGVPRRTLCLTLDNESGVSTENPMRRTCAFEYASGRSRS